MNFKRRIQKINNLWSGIGIIAVFLTMLPCILLGEDAFYTYLDQLDGEMIAYILQARHMFQGNSIPEFMCGASKTALTVPAPLAVLLFLTGNYYGALTFLTLFGKLCGYIGMYLLVRETAGEKWVAALTAFLYSCIPFLSVYGLSEFGIPLLFWCAIQVKKGKHQIVAFLYIILYALSSSLVLVGFGLLGAGLIWILFTFISDRRAGKADKKSILRLTVSWFLLLVIYLAENLRLLGELFGSQEAFVTHKSEYVLSPRPFFEVFWDSLMNGTQHGNGYHKLLLVGTLVAVIIGCIRMFSSKKEASIRPLLMTISFCFSWNLFFAFLSAAWSSDLGINLHSRLSFLGTVQLNRMLWIAPCLWYLAAACGLTIIYRLYQIRFRYIFCLLPVTAAFGATALWTLYSGEFKPNLHKLLNPDYEMISYKDYYAIGVMEQVQAFLDTYTGKSVDEYRVVSLGIDPAAALYHGFYCLDGYSNNYSLDYKKQFREIISPELDKNAYLTQYYDNWGNRCYLFSAECPGYYTIEKHGFYFQNYQINTGALYEMGGRYLLSAAWIQNAAEQGLSLLNETPFETEDSYYYIYVYEVIP